MSNEQEPAPATTPPATRDGTGQAAGEWTAEDLLKKLDDCITTFYPDYGYEWDKEEALSVINAAITAAKQKAVADYVIAQTSGEPNAPLEQPAPATEGEWTVGRVFSYVESEDFKGLAEAINAALAAERENGTRLAKMGDGK
jgi:hypothetical protein